MDKRPKILLVDDNAKAVADLAKYLSGERYVIETACDGSEAVLKAKAFRPDVMILDVQMPVLNGFEVLDKLQEKSIKTRVIMLTGFSMEREDVVKAVRAGACDYFVEPVHPSLVADRIKRHLLDDTSVNLVVSRSAENLVRSAEADAERLRETVKALEGEKAGLVKALEDEKARSAVALTEEKRESVRRLDDKSKAEARRDKRSDLLTKVASVAVAFAVVCGLAAFAELRNAAGLVAVFLTLVALLLIPMDRVRDFWLSTPGVRTGFRTSEADERPGGPDGPKDETAAPPPLCQRRRTEAGQTSLPETSSLR